jgi:hypothetical protein
MDLNENVSDINKGVDNLYNYMKSLAMSPTAAALFFFIIFIYFLASAHFVGSESGSGSGSEPGSNFAMSAGKNIIVIGILFIVIVYGFKYILNIDVIHKIAEILYPTTNAAPPQDTNKDASAQDTNANSNEPVGIPRLSFTKQVFNVPENKYNYEDAKALCSAYSSRLATYNEVESAYNSGGEWCNYGWSDGQMILFPTQKDTYKKLQKIEGHERDCGRPGVNGGYMNDAELRFGVNCYGNKPSMRKQEADLMANVTPFPKTEKDKNFEQKVQNLKSKIPEILLSPFNHNTWARF